MVTTTDTAPRAAAAGPSIVPQGPARLVLIAVTVAVLAETLRYALPLFGGLSAIVPLIFLVGFLAPVVRAVAGPRVLVAAGIGGLLAVRLLAQALSPQLWLAFAGVALGMIAMASLYEAARGLSGVGFATAAVAGLAVDTSVHVAFASWDPVWRTGLAPWAVCLVLVGLGSAALVRELSTGLVAAPGISRRDALGAGALGPFMALQVLVLANPAFVASAGWLPLWGAHLVLIAGQGLALAFLSSGLAVRAVPGGVCVLGGTVLGISAGAVAGEYALSGLVVVPLVIAGQVLAAWLLAVACRAPLRRAGRGGPVWQVDLGAAVGGFLIGLILLPYESDLMPGNLFPGAAGLTLGALAAIAAARGGPLPARAPLRALAGGAMAVVLLIGTLILQTSPTSAARPSAGRDDLRVVSYDIGQAADRHGRIDLTGIARTIGEQSPDVVLLQGVGRGTLRSGGTDEGGWLARRFGMRLIWGPAASGQYGNAILTSRAVVASGAARLADGTGARRGYVWARLRVGGGAIDVWSTHLQDGAGDSAIRIAQAAELVKAWSGAPHTIIGGDLSAEPGSPELARLLDGTGLRSADDDDPTTPGGTHPDWVAGTDDLMFGDAAVPHSGPSGHYPVVVTVRPAG